MAEIICQFNKRWLKKIGALTGAFALILLAGFFAFNFKTQKNEPLKNKDFSAQIALEYTLQKEKGNEEQKLENNLTQEDILLKEEIGQMIMVGFRGLALDNNPAIKKQIEQGAVGGVILFDYDVINKKYQRNIKSKAQVKKLISDLQDVSSTALFVAVDQEGGMVNRLKEGYGFIAEPSPLSMALKGKDFVFQMAKAKADEMKELGINLNLAPVVDVNLNPNNPIIGKLERSFATTGIEVAKIAEQFILGQQEAGIISVAKHFPGHGSSIGDSHLGLVDITLTYKEEELVPYYYLQSKGLLEAVMTAHLVNKNIDPALPATLSPLFIENILRKQIGFQGVVVSDDMQMKAITSQFGFEDGIIKAILAGCNVLVFSNNSGAVYDDEIGSKALEVIFQAVKQGKIPQKNIENSFNLISSLKKNLEKSSN